jgi:hypothetical protein
VNFGSQIEHFSQAGFLSILLLFLLTDRHINDVVWYVALEVTDVGLTQLPEVPVEFGGVQLLSQNFLGCLDTHVTHYCCAYGPNPSHRRHAT